MVTSLPWYIGSGGGGGEWNLSLKFLICQVESLRSSLQDKVYFMGGGVAERH